MGWFRNGKSLNFKCYRYIWKSIWRKTETIRRWQICEAGKDWEQAKPINSYLMIQFWDSPVQSFFVFPKHTKMPISSIIKIYTLKKSPKFSIFFSKKCLRMFGGFLKGKKLIKNRKSDFICLIFCISQTYKSMNLFNYKYIYLEKVAKVLKKILKKILDKDMSQWNGIFNLNIIHGKAQNRFL